MHKYFKTAKIIYNYAKNLKDRRNEEFPILGICQGHELFTMLMTGDKYTLEVINYNAVNRKVHWEDRQS